MRFQGKLRAEIQAGGPCPFCPDPDNVTSVTVSNAANGLSGSAESLTSQRAPSSRLSPSVPRWSRLFPPLLHHLGMFQLLHCSAKQRGRGRGSQEGAQATSASPRGHARDPSSRSAGTISHVNLSRSGRAAKYGSQSGDHAERDYIVSAQRCLIS